MSTHIYNSVGTGYNTTRAADPYLTDQILGYLRPHPTQRYLDIGCGTGNYLAAFTRRGVDAWGVDVSAKMIETARTQCPQTPLLLAAAEQLPLQNFEFGGATAILTTHHWSNLDAGIAEAKRVLKPGARLVLFTYTPEQVQGYWLREYFPRMITDSAALVPNIAVLTRTLQMGGFTDIEVNPYHVRNDLRDHFLYSNKYRPEAYLQPEVRAGASAFSVVIKPEELSKGLSRLQSDIASGRVHEVIETAIAESPEIGDYLFVAATASHRHCL